MYPLGRSRMLCSCYDEKVVWRRLCPGLTVGRQAEGGSGMEESLWAILNPIEDADSDSRRLQPHAGLLTERADKKLQRSSFWLRLSKVRSCVRQVRHYILVSTFGIRKDSKTSWHLLTWSIIHRTKTTSVASNDMCLVFNRGRITENLLLILPQNLYHFLQLCCIMPERRKLRGPIWSISILSDY